MEDFTLKQKEHESRLRRRLKIGSFSFRKATAKQSFHGEETTAAAEIVKDIQEVEGRGEEGREGRRKGRKDEEGEGRRG